jgi:chromate transporter
MARGSASEVFGAFLRLGLTSFGGPIAHLGYFHRALVVRRRWVDDDEFAQLVAICQFLPGPASSQLGFSLGLLRAGWAGAFAAFLAFTLPSALLMLAVARLLPRSSGTLGSSAIHGLQLVALVVVAQGVAAMARRLCPDVPRATIAVLATAILLASGHAGAQLVVVALGAIGGVVLCRDVPVVRGGGLRPAHGAALGWTLLALFAALLVGLPASGGGGDGLVAVAGAFYRAGALVFGGAHVVLPLLENAVVQPGWIARDEFLAGYGAAQAVPGPMFTLAAYLGARLTDGEGGLVGAGVALAAIFAPGLLLVAGTLPLWRTLAERRGAARAIAGVNAAVVGVLAAALYDPLWTSAVRGPIDVAVALVGLALLAVWGLSPLLIVAWCVAASVAAALGR